MHNNSETRARVEARFHCRQGWHDGFVTACCELAAPKNSCAPYQFLAARDSHALWVAFSNVAAIVMRRIARLAFCRYGVPLRGCPQQRFLFRTSSLFRVATFDIVCDNMSACE
jgi:hypothetical protein